MKIWILGGKMVKKLPPNLSIGEWIKKQDFKEDIKNEDLFLCCSL